MTASYERMAHVLRHNLSYHFCLACRQITTPINCGEVHLQRCEHCKSTRIIFYDKPLTPDYGDSN